MSVFTKPKPGSLNPCSSFAFNGLKLFIASLPFSILVLLLLERPLLPVRIRHANERPNDLCQIISINQNAGDAWQYNSRSQCLSSHICLSNTAVYHSSNLSETRCEVLFSTYRESRRALPTVIDGTERTCGEFQHDFIHCAHGYGLRDNHVQPPECPAVEHLNNNDENWMEGISIVVPAYPWLWNIFHFVNVVADLDRTVANLPQLLKSWGRDNVHGEDGNVMDRVEKVNFVLQMSKTIKFVDPAWQKQLLDVFRKRWERQVEVRIEYMADLDKVCLRNAVILGNRGGGYLWPFLNDTEVRVDGMAVPQDALAFKRGAYEGLELEGRLPDEGIPEAPPFVVGFTKRTSSKGEDGYYRWGSSRRLSEADEGWFVDMLQNETRNAGAELMTFAFNSAQTLKEQAEIITKVGFLVGIHGANFVNSIFMRPFGVVMELMPNGFDSACYLGGMNGGFKYLRFESSERASMEESECDPQDYDCEDLRQRLIKMGGQQDRERARRMVREGLGHLKRIREQFSKGAAVKLNARTGHYEVRT